MNRVIAGLSIALLALSPSGVVSAIADEPKSQCKTVLDCAQLAVEIASKAQYALDHAVPAGAVMAFDLEQCPDGWELFDKLAGRVVVGQGLPGEGMETMTFRASSGEQKHLQTVAEMPSHNHHNNGFSLLLKSDGDWTTKGGDPTTGEPNLVASAPILAQGGGQPFNVMQPYYVLTYCKRLP